eukprot:SAG22_NODE_494_length_9810_cov_2.202966_3_plen_91_part_00
MNEYRGRTLNAGQEGRSVWRAARLVGIINKPSSLLWLLDLGISYKGRLLLPASAMARILYLAHLERCMIVAGPASLLDERDVRAFRPDCC